MPNLTITQLPAAGPITGSELVPIVQNGQTLRTTTAALAGSPVQTQTFLTLNQEPTLINSRALSGGTGIGLVDGGALSTLQITLNGASGSLEAAGNGLIAKTGSGSVIARSMAVSGVGLSIADGSGVSGDPTLSLSGLISAIAQVGGTGLLAIQSGTTAGNVLIAGTGNQINVANGNGSGGNPTLSLASDPIIPGNAGMVIPNGTSAEEPVGAPGQFRYNTTTQSFDGYAAGSWRQFALTGGVTTFSAGSTGFTPNSATSGAVTLGGILNPASGGTGVNNGSFSITLGGSVSTAGAFTTSGAFAVTLTATGATSVTLPTTGTLATLAGTETLTNKTISGSSNTLSNIANASLTNSSVTYNGITVALGGSGTITASTTNALTVGTGLQLDSGTTFDGSAAKTISIDSTVATLTGTQTLTNKTISVDNNTVSGIAASSFVLSDASGYIDGAAAQKAIPSGVVVGTTDTQTLTNKTISGSNNTLSNIGNASLTNSAITIGSTSVSLGDTITTLTGVSISGATNTLSNIGNGSLTNSSISFTYAGGISGDASVALGSTNALSLSNIPNASLTNSSITIGTTTIALGATSLTLAGLTSVTLTQNPTSNYEAATKEYVDNLVATGTTYHDPVYVESPDSAGNLNATYDNGTAGVGATLTNAGTQVALTIDGILMTVGKRVLIYNQTNGFENGVYTVTVVGDGSTNWVLTRATDADSYGPGPDALDQGSTFFVQAGNQGAGELYTCTTVGTITFGTTNITFAQIGATQIYSAGTGLTLTGTQFSLTNPVAENLGGTGQSSYTAGDILYASGATTLSKLALGTQGYVLKAGATGPEWGVISGGTF